MKSSITLQKKKPGVSKGKLKKTVKNILSRPDPVSWPNISDDESKSVECLLKKYKVSNVEKTKPHWNELKLMTKDQRRELNKVEKIQGIKFGITECHREVEAKNNSLLIVIDSGVNPQMIIHPLLNLCKTSHVLAICVRGLRETTHKFFGISSTCIGVMKNGIPELYESLYKIAEKYNKYPKNAEKQEVSIEKPENVEVDTIKENEHEKPKAACPYLYRDDKRTRVFVPDGKIVTNRKEFRGQDYIKFSSTERKKLADRKQFMNMILKKVTSNSNR